MTQMQCNKCGKLLRMKNGIAHEDYVFVHKEWGYFSTRDGKTQEFILCEKCIEELGRGFLIPSRWEDTTEML